MIERTIVLPDVHTPNHNEKALNVVIDFIKYFKPHRVIQLGDFCDFDSLSTFKSYHPDHFITLEEELESANNLLDRLDKAIPKTCKKYMIGGNHEDRYHQAKARFMFPPDKVTKAILQWKDTWADEYELDKRGWKWCEYGRNFQFGKIVYTHGWSAGKTNAASREAGHFPGHNVIFGHTHRHQVFGAIDHNQLPIESETIGTLSNFDLSYLRGKPPTDWVNGFMVIYTKPSGIFSKYFIHIIDGSFIFNGKEFKS